jgi:hypothetical protein
VKCDKMKVYVIDSGERCAKHPPQPLAGCMIYTSSAVAETNQNTPKAIAAPSAKNLQRGMEPAARSTS